MKSATKISSASLASSLFSHTFSQAIPRSQSKMSMALAQSCLRSGLTKAVLLVVVDALAPPGLAVAHQDHDVLGGHLADLVGEGVDLHLADSDPVDGVLLDDVARVPAIVAQPGLALVAVAPLVELHAVADGNLLAVGVDLVDVCLLAALPEVTGLLADRARLALRGALAIPVALVATFATFLDLAGLRGVLAVLLLLVRRDLEHVGLPLPQVLLLLGNHVALPGRGVRISSEKSEHLWVVAVGLPAGGQHEVRVGLAVEPAVLGSGLDVDPEVVDQLARTPLPLNQSGNSLQPI